MLKQIVLFIFLSLIIIYLYIDFPKNKKLNKKLNKKFYELDESFPFLKTIGTINNINIIKSELNCLLDDNIWNEWPEYNLWKNKTNTTNTTKWTIFPIKAINEWSKKNIKLCPKTYEILKNIPNLVNAGFSRLGPKTVLDGHYGWGSISNNILRCHLALIVPGKAHIYCEDEKRQQIENQWIVFDDSKWHYADNMADSDRIVLILDILRPKHIELGKSTQEDTTELLGFIKEFNESK
jgi:aspartyl/asparaginyl beta-hydroxylase (cupin superfamily)